MATVRQFDAWLMVDDAHGCGVIDGGKGATTRDVDLHMGTLSKALGAYGGFVCASRPVIDLIRGRARSLVYSTGLPPAVIAAALAALDVIAAEPDRVARPLTHARLFTTRLKLRKGTYEYKFVLEGKDWQSHNAGFWPVNAGLRLGTRRDPP